MILSGQFADSSALAGDLTNPAVPLNLPSATASFACDYRYFIEFVR
jgi:hypothetical protein